MNSRKAYWFEQPYLQGVKNIAVCPIVDPRDGRMYFSVPGSGIWGLYGTLIKDTEDYIEFRCDDSHMGNRGGTYKLYALDIKLSGRTLQSGLPLEVKSGRPAKTQMICISGIGRIGRIRRYLRSENGKCRRTKEKGNERIFSIPLYAERLEESGRFFCARKEKKCRDLAS